MSDEEMKDRLRKWVGDECITESGAVDITIDGLVKLVQSEVRRALAPRSPSPELAEAEQSICDEAAAVEKLVPGAGGRCAIIADELDRLRAENVRLTERLGKVGGFDRRAADELADEVDVLVRRHVIDSRSPAADALLDYREPPSSTRSDRLIALETEVERLQEFERRVRAANTREWMDSTCGEVQAAVEELDRARKKPAPAPAQDRATPLPCPWCGKWPQVDIGLGHHFVGCMTDDCPAQPAVAATGDVDSAENTDEAAIRRWNTRITAERGKDPGE